MTSRICACTVTSSAVVGSSAMSTSGSLAIAMAIITRWRMPPENSCGYCDALVLGCGMPTMSSNSTARSSAAALDMSLCERIISATWLPILWVGLSADSGSWKIIEMRLPRCARICLLCSPTSSWPCTLTEPSILADVGQQAHGREEGHRLAGTALADHAEHLAAVDAHVDAANCLDVAALGREGDSQVADLEYRLFLRTG